MMENRNNVRLAVIIETSYISSTPARSALSVNGCAQDGQGDASLGNALSGCHS